MAILYIETNFLISIATGRDPEADELLLNPPASVKIAIPGICCMEALSWLEEEQKRRRRFRDELRKQISQLKRDVTSSSAQSLLLYLRESLVEDENFLNDIEVRLLQALNRLAEKSTIIELKEYIIKDCLNIALVEKEQTDNLILHAVLNHARSQENEVKALLSGNVKEFGKSNVLKALRDAGVGKYFARTQDFMGWLQSQL